MPLVRRIRKRGATITVEAHGEVLFAATGDVGRWTNRFSQRVRSFASQEAPSNKRPRWAHYGKPLKSTMTASTTYQPGRMRVYSAVGSTAAHAAYVDQGTGVYNGGGAYPAKILPPWAVGSPSLYEHTWRPPSGGTAGRGGAVWARAKAAPVMIKGQKGQFFFDAALARGFRSMRLRGVQVPGEGGPKISGVLGSLPSQLVPGGNTPVSGAFIASLTEWRAWRDEAYNRGRVLGVGHNSERQRRYDHQRDVRERQAQRRQSNADRRAQKARERAQKWRDAQKAKNQNQAKNVGQTKPKQTDQQKAIRKADKAAFIAAMMKKYGNRNVDLASLEFKNGYWYILVRKVTETASGDLRPEWVQVRGKAKS